jgi:hypothetical protein
MKAVLVFCEGAHDVAFVQRSLGASENCEFLTGRTIDRLPTPFGRGTDAPRFGGRVGQGIIAAYYSSRDIDGLSFSAASRAPTPIFDSALIREPDTHYYLLRSDGDAKATENLELLRRIDAAFQFDRASYQIQQIAHAFIYDADALGVDGRETKFLADHGAFFGLSSAVAHARWCSSDKGPVGLWVHHDSVKPDRSGTLEDVLAPMFADAIPERWGAASEYIASQAREEDPVHRKRVKAQITIAGQMARPGDPMSEMLRRSSKDRGELLQPEVFKAGPARALADFLFGVPW